MDTGSIPTWLAGVIAVGTALVFPAWNRLSDWRKARTDRADAVEDKLYAHLKEELGEARKATNECEERHKELTLELRRVERRCAKLEAVIAHLHPEVAADLLKD